MEQRCRGRATVTQSCIPLTLSGPFPPLRCRLRARPVEKCFEKKEMSQLNSIAMHDDGIVSLISFTHFFGGPFAPILNRLMALNLIKYLQCRAPEWLKDLNILPRAQNDNLKNNNEVIVTSLWLLETLDALQFNNCCVVLLFF